MSLMPYMNTLYTNLAPTNLANKRLDRFTGDGFSIMTDNFTPADQTILTTIYQRMKSVYDLWLYMRHSPDYTMFEPFVEYFAGDEALRLGKAFGESTYLYAPPPENVRKVVHDVRGGALTSMIFVAQTIQRHNLLTNTERMRNFVFLARDHAKMMRNAILDIDIPTRNADERFNLHAVSDYIDKWQGIEFDRGECHITVRVQSSYKGSIATRCLEASAIDRVLYNFINNAVRFANSEEILLTIFPVGDGTHSVLRWVVENRLSNNHMLWLQENVGDDLSTLFKGGITRGGNGLGLTNCVDFVSEGFGVSSDTALEQGYIGAQVINRTYYAWFHWNIA